MSEWKPGYVKTMTRADVQVEKGQRWGYFKPGPDGTTEILPGNIELVLPVVVVATLSTGEVVLRPDLQKAERMFPARETVFKGKPVIVHDCPFQWVDEAHAKAVGEQIRKLTEARTREKDPGKARELDRKLAENFPYQAGDLCAHEAWDVWRDMHLHTSGIMVPVEG